MAKLASKSYPFLSILALEVNLIKKIDLEGGKFSSLTELFLSKNSIESLESIKRQQMPKLRKLCLGKYVLIKMETK